MPVAAVLLALVFSHAAERPSLDVYPQQFSPKVTRLTLSASLPGPTVAGIRLVTASGQLVGWIVEPKRRRSISRFWKGRLNGGPVRDGYYRAQLLAGDRVVAEKPLRLDTAAPSLSNFETENGGEPFAGDGPLLTTITPNGDGVRDEASISFDLDEPGTVALQIEATKRIRTVVYADTERFGTGRQSLAWTPPATIAPRTYLFELTVTDKAGNARSYGAQTPYTSRFRPGPVVRVLGIDATFTRQSYAPGDAGVLRVATDATSFTMQFFRVGGEAKPTYLADEMSGLPVGEPIPISWISHRDEPATIRVLIGDWPTGVYYAELRSADDRIGYAPFVLRPPTLGATARVAVIMATNTWEAYNFYDTDGDGWGDTWYAGRDDLTVSLHRPYLNHGVPPKFHRYETPFLNWMAREHLAADFFAESDLADVATGKELADRYDLVVYPTHSEYVTDHEYDVIEQYRDAGGNLIFLSANSFFRRVVNTNDVLTRTSQWRDIGRPEAALLGAQYRGNDEGGHQGLFIVRNTHDVPWLWVGTDLTEGSTFGQTVGGYGVEIDGKTPDSPKGTKVLAEIPDLLGPGLTAQMTYYETGKGAKVFDAGTLDFAGSALTFPVDRILINLWTHLSVP